MVNVVRIGTAPADFAVTATGRGLGDAGSRAQPVDAAGAGDALLVGVLREPTLFEDHAVLGRVCRFANAVGQITTMGRGAIPSLPTRATVNHFPARQGKGRT